MNHVLFEGRDATMSVGIAHLFQRHLVELKIYPPHALDSNVEEYASSDAVVVMIGDGFLQEIEYLKRISMVTAGPVIAIASEGLSGWEKALLLEAGASDCLSSPFCYRELLARLRARARRFALMRANLRPDNYLFGCFGLDVERKEIRTSMASSRLSAKELSLLIHFVKNNFEPLSRDELLNALDADELEAMDRSVDSLVSRLRERLESMGSASNIIRTIRSVGYIFESHVEPVPAGYDLNAALIGATGEICGSNSSILLPEVSSKIYNGASSSKVSL